METPTASHGSICVTFDILCHLWFSARHGHWPFREFHNSGSRGWPALLEDFDCRLLQLCFSIADGQKFHREPAVISLFAKRCIYVGISDFSSKGCTPPRNVRYVNQPQKVHVSLQW